MALTLLARIQLGQGNLRGACTHGRWALDNHRRTGHRIGEARTLIVLGHARQRDGDTGAARDHRRQAHTLLAAIGATEAAEVASLLSG